MDDIKNILEKFGLYGAFTAEKINSGHINLTLKITYDKGEKYILQRLNGKVFMHPEAVMSNIELISDKLKRFGGFLYCRDKNYIVESGNILRVYKYIDDSISYDKLYDEKQIYEFGRAVGEFHKSTSVVSPSALFQPIEHFHDTKFYLERVLSLEKRGYRKEYAFFEDMLPLAEADINAELPKRVIHGDVKCSNVLFDKQTGKAITLIDFDTVMPGAYCYDFGDGARSCCCDTAGFDTERFRAFCKGYFSQFCPPERESFYLGIVCVTAELSARYFYDYLCGGDYFENKTSAQKLERTRELMKLAESVIRRKDEIAKIISECGCSY